MKKRFQISVLIMACMLSGLYLSAQQNDVQNKDRTVTVEVEEEDGKKQTNIKVTENGETKEFNWTGEMPEDIKKQLSDMDVNVFSTSGDAVFISEDDADGHEQIEVIIKNDEESGDHIWIDADDLHERIQDDMMEMEVDGFKMKTVKVQVGEDGKNVFIIKKDGDVDTIHTQYDFEHSDDGDIKVHVDVDPANDNDAFLGVVIEKNITETIENDQTERQVEVKVGDVIEGSGADLAGIKKGDLILEVAGVEITEDHSVIDALSPFSPNDEVEIKISRDGQTQTLTATLGGRPASHSGTSKRVIIKKIKTDDSGEESIESKGSFTPERTLQLQDFEAFPNPNEGLLRLRLKADIAPLTVKLTDLEGKELYTRNIKNFKGNLDEEIDISLYPKGTLLLLIEQQGKVFTEKVVHQ